MDKYFLPILGSSVDSFYQAEQYPMENDFTHAKFLGKSAGGCPFNVAACVASKNLLVKSLDMLGTNDDTTTFLLNESKRLNINTEFVYQNKDVSNGKVLIINTGDNRTMFVVDPIRPTYTIDNKIQSFLNNATYIYSLLHMINRSFDNIEPLLIAKKAGAKIIIDGSSKYDDPSRVKMLYELADAMFISKNDYERLKNASNNNPEGIILSNGGLFVCVTSGCKGATLYTKENIYHENALKDIKVIDSTGAGDGFAGGFISALMMDMPYNKALKLANVNGAYACTVFGGLGGVASIETLTKFAKEHNYDL